MFKKGEPRPPGAGRKKGVPNKFRLTKVRDYFVKHEIDLVQRVWEWIGEVENAETKASLALRLLAWCEPRRTQIENIGERAEPAPTGLEHKSDGDLFHVLRPDAANEFK